MVDDDLIAKAILEEWCRRHQFFYDSYLAHNGPDFFYPPDLEPPPASEEFSTLMEFFMLDMNIFQRWAIVNSLRPRRWLFDYPGANALNSNGILALIMHFVSRITILWVVMVLFF